MAGIGKSTATRSRQRLQRALVVAQIAVSVILLTGAGLLVRTMMQLAEVKDGLNAPQVLTMEVQTDFDTAKAEVTRLNFEAMRDHIAAMPGVTEVGLGSTMPLRNSGFQLEIKAEGRPLAPNEPQPRADYRTASPEYFKAAGIPLLKGRDFNSGDRKGSARVVILNKALAERLFPNIDPIGQRVAWTGEVLKFIPVSGDWRTVVGVVGDTKDDGLDAGSRPVMFQPFDQEFGFGGGLVIRAQRDAMAMAPGAMKEVHGVSPTSPIENVLTVDQIRDESIAPRRLNAVLIAIFGVLAVVIAAVGIAGVLAFSVSARTNEIGIRMALGADRLQVQRMVLGEGGVLLVGGLALGVLGSWLATRTIQGALFGVPPHDPATLSAVAAVMLTIGLVACWIPALRAARIDPALAMKAQ
jgi:predicted permease